MKETNVKSVLRQGRFASSPLSADGAPSHTGGRGYEVTPLNQEHLEAFAMRSTRTGDKKVGLPSGAVPIQESSRNGKRTMKFHVKGYGKSGPIQSRINATSILLKRWSDSYWLHVYPATVNIFESEEKMRHWKTASDDDKKNKASVKRLVQLSINFDTMGRLKEQIDAYEEIHRDDEREDGHSSAISTRKSDIETIRMPYKLLMEDVRSKYYTRKGPLLHTCKISFFSQSGRNILAAFGSKEPKDLKRIRSVFRNCIRLVGKATQRHKKLKSQGHDGTYDGASVISGVSGMGKSAITAISNTQYGELTLTEDAKRRWKEERRRKLR